MVGLLRIAVIVLVVIGSSLPLQAAGNEQTASAIEAFIKSGELSLGNESDDQRLIQIFTYYSGRSFKPIWVRDGHVKAKAKVLYKTLLRAGDYGLDNRRYDMEAIADRMDSDSPEELAELDLVLSNAFANFASDVANGHVRAGTVDISRPLQPREPGPLNVLGGAENATDLMPYIAQLEPKNPRYHRLKQALKNYRKIAAQGGWPKLAAGQVLKPGMHDGRLKTLVKRLQITGDLTGTHHAQSYDAALVEAVKKFQTRHGKEPDGIVGPGTLRALNVPVKNRIEQLSLNMERRRWMQDVLGQRFIFVNLADQFLKLVEMHGGVEKTIFASRLVVGKNYHATPVFSRRVSYLVINPYWNVPSSIANREYLPMLKRNPYALKSKKIKVIGASGPVDPGQVNWRGMKRMSYRLRQDSGPLNALGRIKFMFPNKYNIYIHDTPAKALFSKAQRYFSHGCMRLQNPIELADILLKNQGWSIPRIKQQIASGKRKIVNLKNKLPVHVTYLTAWADKDGTVQFRDDIYKRDKKLTAALRIVE